MEVMNRAELTQNDILVGNRATTRSFGVSDDPMLMSMLSTGFYQNPLRTMCQEIMFNAWDAHRMGNCQHRPIDIYINETSGLVVRDYGPGIEPGENDDNMHEIYCMYGGSTKRKLKNQTGGFGLGSKSPFAYTESFTVTSHFGGTKNMYLISRVSDANGGKPGMTSLVRVPTTETGLMVTVPLRIQDVKKTYEYVKDLLFLSGIKAMIHFEDEADEFIDSLILNAGEYHVDSETRNGGIYAVYGGVKYMIPRETEYETEYEFMRLLSKNCSVFVGFAPDTLSPLPNREGLNMGEKSKESVRATFELCTEKFQEAFEPLAKAFMESVFKYLLGTQLQGHFAFIAAAKYGCASDASGIRLKIKDSMEKLKPSTIDDDVWQIGTDLIILQTNSILPFVTRPRWKIIFLSAFIKAYPEWKHLAFAARAADWGDVFPTSRSEQASTFVSEHHNTQFIRDQMNFYREMQKAFPDDDTFHPMMRIYSDDLWIYPIRERTKANIEKTKYGVKGLKPEDPRLVRKDSYFSLEKLYNKRGGEYQFLMMDKVVLVAKTANALRDTPIPSEVQIHNSVLKQNWRYYGSELPAIPAYVIHERKGGYAKALEILKNMGFTIFEGSEPEKKIYIPKVKTDPTYPLIRWGHGDDWCSKNPNDQISDPTHFFYATMGTLKGYSSSEKPESNLVTWFRKKNPKLVMVNHAKVAESLEKTGVVPIHKAIEAWYIQASLDTNRMLNTVRAAYITHNSHFPDVLLNQPLMQLEMGMEPVDESDTDFWYEAEGYNLLMNTNFYPLNQLRKKVKADTEQLWKLDPEKKNICKMCDVTKVFQEYAISSLWSSTAPADYPQVTDKIIAAMKLFM